LPERVLLLPTPLEYGLHQDKYDALRDELEGQGVLVRLLAPLESRGVPQNGEFYDLVIHVGEIAGVTLGTAKLMATVQGRLRDGGEPLTGSRRAKLYLPDGEERVFNLSEENS
jgi:hypothetical protein